MEVLERHGSMALMREKLALLINVQHNGTNWEAVAEGMNRVMGQPSYFTAKYCERKATDVLIQYRGLENLGIRETVSFILPSLQHEYVLAIKHLLNTGPNAYKVLQKDLKEIIENIPVDEEVDRLYEEYISNSGSPAMDFADSDEYTETSPMNIPETGKDQEEEEVDQNVTDVGRETMKGDHAGTAHDEYTPPIHTALQTTKQETSIAANPQITRVSTVIMSIKQETKTVSAIQPEQTVESQTVLRNMKQESTSLEQPKRRMVRFRRAPRSRTPSDDDIPDMNAPEVDDEDVELIDLVSPEKSEKSRDTSPAKAAPVSETADTVYLEPTNCSTVSAEETRLSLFHDDGTSENGSEPTTVDESETSYDETQESDLDSQDESISEPSQPMPTPLELGQLPPGYTRQKTLITYPKIDSVADLIAFAGPEHAAAMGLTLPEQVEETAEGTEQVGGDENNEAETDTKLAQEFAEQKDSLNTTEEQHRQNTETEGGPEVEQFEETETVGEFEGRESTEMIGEDETVFEMEIVDGVEENIQEENVNSSDQNQFEEVTSHEIPNVEEFVQNEEIQDPEPGLGDTECDISNTVLEEYAVEVGTDSTIVEHEILGEPQTSNLSERKIEDVIVVDTAQMTDETVVEEQSNMEDNVIPTVQTVQEEESHKTDIVDATSLEPVSTAEVAVDTVVQIAVEAEVKPQTTQGKKKRQRGSRLHMLFEEATTLFHSDSEHIEEYERSRVTRARRPTGLSSGSAPKEQPETPVPVPVPVQVEEDDAKKFLKLGIDILELKERCKEVDDNRPNSVPANAPTVTPQSEISQEEKRKLLHKVEQIIALKESSILKRKAKDNSGKATIAKFFKADTTLPMLLHSIKEGLIVTESETLCNMNLMLLNASVLKKNGVKVLSQKIWQIMNETEPPQHHEVDIEPPVSRSRSRLSSTSSSSSKKPSVPASNKATKRSAKRSLPSPIEAKKSRRSSIGTATRKQDPQDVGNVTTSVASTSSGDGTSVNTSRLRNSPQPGTSKEAFPFFRNLRSIHKS